MPHPSRPILPVALAVVGSSLLAGCGAGDDDAATTGGDQSPVAVQIQFEGRVGGKKFDCSKAYPDLGRKRATLTFSDYRLYVHDVTLHRIDGEVIPLELEQDGLWQYQDVALLDFEDRTGACVNGTPETNAVIRGKAPPGDYRGIGFVIGLPFDLNHGDGANAPSPLNLSALFWDWNAGHKFLRVDAQTSAGSPFLVHLGSTGCMPDGAGKVATCSRDNLAEIMIMGPDPRSATIGLEYAALVAGVDIANDKGGAPGCMSDIDDPECVNVLGALGIDLYDGSLHPEEQTFARGD